MICVLPSNFSSFDPDLENDPETGKPYDEDGTVSDKIKRDGSSRSYTIDTGTETFTIRSPTYPGGENGARLLAANQNAGHYGLEDAQDCDVRTNHDESCVY